MNLTQVVRKWQELSVQHWPVGDLFVGPMEPLELRDGGSNRCSCGDEAGGPHTQTAPRATVGGNTGRTGPQGGRAESGVCTTGRRQGNADEVHGSGGRGDAADGAARPLCPGWTQQGRGGRPGPALQGAVGGALRERPQNKAERAGGLWTLLAECKGNVRVKVMQTDVPSRPPRGGGGPTPPGTGPPAALTAHRRLCPSTPRGPGGQAGACVSSAEPSGDPSGLCLPVPDPPLAGLGATSGRSPFQPHQGLTRVLCTDARQPPRPQPWGGRLQSRGGAFPGS